MTTFMPAFENARAMPRPMPSDDAVTYAVLPATSFSGAGCETVGSGGGGGRPPGGGPPAPAPAGGAFCARALCPPTASTVAAPAPAARDPRNLRRSSASCSTDRDDEEGCLLAIRALICSWHGCVA